MIRSSSLAATPAFLALAAIGFIASAPAQAADDKGAVKADDKNVPAAPEDDQDAEKKASDKRNDIVVNGSRVEQQGPKAVARLVDTPRSVVVLPEEVIAQTGSNSLADALRTVPGITFGAAEGGNPVGDRPFIRGFDSQGSTFVDGVRDIAAQSREVFATEQVQIVRGSDSTLGGRGSAGGSINIITKLPVTGNFVRGTAGVGTDDYKRFTGDVNYNISDFAGVRVAAMWHDQDFAGRDAIWAQRWGVAPSITLGLNSDTRLTAAYYYLESHELPDAGIPYLYTIGNGPAGEFYSEPALGRITTMGGVTGTVDRDTFYGLKSRDFRDTTTHQATLRAEHDFGGITLRNTARYNYNNQAYIYTQPDDQQGNVFGTTTTNTAPNLTNGGYVWRRANTRYGYSESIGDQLDLFGTFNTGSIKHSFAMGGEISWEKARRGTFVLSTGSTVSPRCNTTTVARFYCTSLFNPNPNDAWVNYSSDTATTTAPITQTAPNAETQNDASTKSVYLFDSITLLPALILNLGARYDHFESKVTPPFVAGTAAVTLKRADDIFNWQAGLVFKPTRNTTLYASYATAATPPNSLLGEGQEANALPTTVTAANLALLDSLKVEKTKSYEVGAKAELFDSQLSVSLAAFQTDTENARVAGPNSTVEFVGQRRIRGVELSFNGNVTKWLSVFGGYTHLDPKIIDAGVTTIAVAANGPALATVAIVPSVSNGRQATQTAKDSFTLWANVTPTSRFSFGGGAFYTSRVFGGYSETGRTAMQTTTGVITVTAPTKVRIVTVPEYWRFDARMGYKFTDKIELSVNVQNLTDKAYFTQAYTAHYATIAPGRSAFATLAVKF